MDAITKVPVEPEDVAVGVLALQRVEEDGGVGRGGWIGVRSAGETYTGLLESERMAHRSRVWQSWRPRAAG